MRAESLWKGLLAAAVLVAVAALFLSRPSGECPLLPRSGQQTPAPNASTTVTIPKGSIQHADDASFSEMVLKADVPVLVDFYADWCGPCQRLAPLLEEMAAEVPSVRVVKVNVDVSPTLASQYGIRSIPNLKVFKRGEITGEHVGLATKSQLMSLVAR